MLSEMLSLLTLERAEDTIGLGAWAGGFKALRDSSPLGTAPEGRAVGRKEQGGAASVPGRVSLVQVGCLSVGSLPPNSRRDGVRCCAGRGAFFPLCPGHHRCRLPLSHAGATLLSYPSLISSSWLQGK